VVVRRYGRLDIEIKYGGETSTIFGSFAGKKFDCILAWHNGKQTDKDFFVVELA
jgi:hypothetical protein